MGSTEKLLWVSSNGLELTVREVSDPIMHYKVRPGARAALPPGVSEVMTPAKARKFMERNVIGKHDVFERLK